MAPQKKVEAVVRLEVLEERDEGLGAQAVGVLCGDLHDDLLVVSAALCCMSTLRHSMQFSAVELAKESDEKLGVDRLRVDDDALDGVDVRVELESALERAPSFRRARDAGLVVVRKHLRLEDGVGDLRRAAQRLISRSRVCRQPSSFLLPFSASSRNAVVSWMRFICMNTSTTTLMSTRDPTRALTSILAKSSAPLGFWRTMFCSMMP